MLNYIDRIFPSKTVYHLLLHAMFKINFKISNDLSCEIVSVVLEAWSCYKYGQITSPGFFVDHVSISLRWVNDQVLCVKAQEEKSEAE